MKTIIGTNSYDAEMMPYGWTVSNISPGQVIVTNGDKNHSLPGPNKRGWRPVWDQWLAKLRRQEYKAPVLREFTEDDWRGYGGAEEFEGKNPLIITWQENGFWYDLILDNEMTGLYIYHNDKHKCYSIDLTAKSQEEAYVLAKRFLRTLEKYGTGEFKQIYPMRKI